MPAAIHTLDIESVVDVLQCLRGAAELHDAAHHEGLLAHRARRACCVAVWSVRAESSHSTQEAEDVAALAQLDWTARQTEAHAANHETALWVADDIDCVEA